MKQTPFYILIFFQKDIENWLYYTQKKRLANLLYDLGIILFIICLVNSNEFVDAKNYKAKFAAAEFTTKNILHHHLSPFVFVQVCDFPTLSADSRLRSRQADTGKNHFVATGKQQPVANSRLRLFSHSLFSRQIC